MTKTELVRNTFAALNNKKYASYEDMENDILPLYGPLQPSFPGEGFRDMIDRMIGAKWIIDHKDGTYTVKIEPATATTATNEAPKVIAPLDTLPQAACQNIVPSVWLPSLSFREIYWLVKFNSAQVVRDNEFVKHDFSTLIDKGLVEYVDLSNPLPDGERERVYAALAPAKMKAAAAIMNDDFSTAWDLVCDLLDTATIDKPDMVYRLTEKGKQYMALQHDAVEPTA